MSKFVKIRGTSHTTFAAEEMIINVEQITAVTITKSGWYSYFVNLSGGPDIYIDSANARLLFSYMGISL